ncbi:MAG: phage holin family protein [Candidatus Daviesbacteria bacterium]|nr:phage holin family protein [Candidatus Daviesbacteria bacterium]
MKTLLRYFLINLVSLWAATKIISGLTYTGGVKSLIIGGIAFMAINLLLVPLLRILFLPLNLLTLGLFAWLINVLALYVLTSVISDFQLVPYTFSGINYNGLTLPAYDMSPFFVAIAASFVIGIITHFLQWLTH